MTRPTPAVPRLRQCLVQAMLLLALLLAPLLGRMHQVVHASAGPAPWAQHAGGERGAAQQAVDALHALFAGHGSADCQVLDQHTLGAGAWLAHAALLVRALPGQAPAGSAQAARARRRAAPFQARAPPPGLLPLL